MYVSVVRTGSVHIKSTPPPSSPRFSIPLLGNFRPKISLDRMAKGRSDRHLFNYRTVNRTKPAKSWTIAKHCAIIAVVDLLWGVSIWNDSLGVTMANLLPLLSRIIIVNFHDIAGLVLLTVRRLNYCKTDLPLKEWTFENFSRGGSRTVRTTGMRTTVISCIAKQLTILIFWYNWMLLAHRWQTYRMTRVVSQTSVVEWAIKHHLDHIHKQFSVANYNANKRIQT